MNQLAQSRITIVVLGLIGGSLAGAMRGQCKEVVGMARRLKTI